MGSPAGRDRFVRGLRLATNIALSHAVDQPAPVMYERLFLWAILKA